MYQVDSKHVDVLLDEWKMGDCRDVGLEMLKIKMMRRRMNGSRYWILWNTHFIEEVRPD